MRNPAATVRALEAKAADPAVTGPERAALLAKALELRERHAMGASPPHEPPRPASAPASAPDPGWAVFTFTSSNGTTTTTSGTTTTTSGTFTWSTR